MSTAAHVPETWELDGDDARQTLLATGRRTLARDSFVRLRAADGFTHARSVAFLMALVMVQGVIGLVGLASSRGEDGLGAAIARTIEQVAPGPMGRTINDAVFQASLAGSSGKWVALVFGLFGALVTGTTLMGQFERALNRLYGIEQDRPTLQKYSRAFALACSAGVLALASFIAFAFGPSIGRSTGGDTGASAWRVVRWPLGLMLAASAIALLFRWAPNRRQPAWSWLAFGSTLAVLLWSIVTFVLGWFFERSGSFGDAYGPLAGIVALLLWALLSSMVVLYGAAVAAQLEAVRAGRSEPRDPAKEATGPAARPAPGEPELVRGTA